MTRGAFVVVFAMLMLGSSPAVAAPPPNDNFANAQPLSAAASVPGTTVESTVKSVLFQTVERPPSDDLWASPAWARARLTPGPSQSDVEPVVS